MRRQSLSLSCCTKKEMTAGEGATQLLERKLTLPTACLWTLWDTGTQRWQGVHAEYEFPASPIQESVHMASLLDVHVSLTLLLEEG